jgi:hypothetical protein
MASITWNGVSGNWTNAANWSGGVAPGAGDTANLTGAGAYTVTLYSAASIGGVTMNAANALFYDAGVLTLGGIFALQAGTFALAYGSLDGGTLALDGGTLAAEGGTLDDVAVQGTLQLNQSNATLFVQGGLAMAGAGGSGAGSIQLTGSYAALNFLGSQTLANANVSFGATGPGHNQGGPATLSVSETFGATQGATLTIASNVWVREAGTVGQIIVGGSLPTGYTDEVLNKGTLTDAVQGSTLTFGGDGDFINQGTIGISNGATLDIASGTGAGGFANTGSVVVTDATLEFGGTFTASLLGSLGNLTLNGATVEIGGDAVNTGGTLSVSAGSALGPLGLAGTITGGTILDTGGGLSFAPDSGVLDGLTYVGTLSLGAGNAVTLADNTVLATGGSGAGNASISGAGAALLLEGAATTLNNATITVGSNIGTASLGTTDQWMNSQATTATLGANLVIMQGGKFAAVDANATTPIGGFGLADTLINQGNMDANFAGGTFTIGGYGSFINQGTITASSQATLVINAISFANTGTLALSGGATAVLGGPPDVYGQTPAWSNSGVISLNNATLVLSGAMKTGQLGQISGTGTIVMAGTLANTGATLTLGSGGQLPALSLTGTIIGGTLADPGGNLSIGPGGTAMLEGVSETGTLNLSGAGAYVRVRDNLVLSGAADITGAGSEIGFLGSQAFGQAQVLLGAAGTAAVIDVLHDYGQQGGSTLTLGSALSITQSGLLAAIGTSGDVTGDAIINYGTITAAVAGGTFALGGADFINRGTVSVSGGDTLAITAASFVSGGTISVTNAGLSIADSLTLAALGNLQLNNATVGISGTLNNQGGTLALGAGSNFGRLMLTGTIQGGVIQDSGEGLNAAGSATLDNVTYEGELYLDHPFQTLTLDGGINLAGAGGNGAGTLLLTGAASRVIATGNETINNATVYLGSIEINYYGQKVAPAELAAGAGSTLTIGTNAVVRSAGYVGWLGDCNVGDWTDSIVNNGTIVAATSAGILTIGSSFFTNNAAISIGNGGNIMFNGVAFTNAGTISISPGSDLMLSLFSYFEAPDSGPVEFTNTGLIHLVGGALVELTGGGLFPSVPVVNAAGGLMQGVGNIIAPIVNNGVIEGKYGPNLSVMGALTGTGSLQIDPSCVLELGASVGPNQTVNFTSTSETLRLNTATQFAGQINNFIGGDAIDLAGQPVTSLAVSNGTLVLGTAAGQARLHMSQPLGGALEVALDTHSGSIVNYTQQTQGGPAVTIGVYQPKMLFWASSVGDIFTGQAATVQGADISNWTTADRLDIIDMLGTKTTVAYVQASGQGTITVTDGVHTDSVTLIGSYNASWFQVGTDAHGGALITYSQS